MQPYDEWLATLSKPDRRRADALLQQLKQVGAPEPETWMRSEVTDNIPQLTRYLVLRHLWNDINEWQESLDNFESARQLLADGADAAVLARFARAVAYDSVFFVLDTIDEGYDPDAPEDFPGWKLVETNAQGKPTGRDVGGLHENLLSLDPSGREGSDLD